jgi:transposase InsO family protein
MSTKASPWENGYQESFYDNFKTDLGLEFERFTTIGAFVEAIHTTIQKYNTKRIHLALKMSPLSFKKSILSKPCPFKKCVQQKGYLTFLFIFCR